MEISTYLSIITKDVNGLNTPIKRHRVSDWIEVTRPFYMLPIRDSFQGKRHTQTESEGIEIDISCKQKLQESRDSNTHIRQNRL